MCQKLNDRHFQCVAVEKEIMFFIMKVEESEHGDCWVASCLRCSTIARIAIYCGEVRHHVQYRGHDNIIIIITDH